MAKRGKTTRGKPACTSASVDKSSPALDIQVSTEGLCDYNAKSNLPGANSRMQGQPVKTGVHSALALKDIPVGCTPYTPTWAGEESSVVLVLSVP